MASFGTGVATGQLHEITDFSMATDYGKSSIRNPTAQSDPDKETSVVSVDNIDTCGQYGVNLDEESVDNCVEARSDNKSNLDIQNNEINDSKSNLDIQNDENHAVALEQKALEAMVSAENVEMIHPPPKDLLEGATDVTNNELDNEAKADINLQISQDPIDEFEKHVQSKTTSKSDLQPSERENVVDLTASTLNEDTVSGTNVTLATYTRTKTAKDITETRAPATKSKDISGLSSRQTTSSSAGARSDSQSDSLAGKPDSGYGRRRHRRRQEDIKTNYSRQGNFSRERDCSRDEVVSVVNHDQYDSLHKRKDEYLSDRFQSPRQPYEDGATQKTLLELMTRGLGNFTEQMANVMIEKIRPEYETLSRQVAKEVQEATMFELKELREKIVNAQEALKDLEKEKDHLKKLLDNEKTKRLKEVEDKDAQIKKLEKDLEQSKVSLKERDRVVKKAEQRAKAEEQKRVQLEQDYQEQCTSLKRLLDRAKGDLLVYRSKKRVAQSNEKQDVMTLTNRLSSHH